MDREVNRIQGIAQMVEHMIWDHEAAGSSPASLTSGGSIGCGLQWPVVGAEMYQVSQDERLLDEEREGKIILFLDPSTRVWRGYTPEILWCSGGGGVLSPQKF